jgi:hypothetical protein
VNALGDALLLAVFALVEGLRAGEAGGHGQEKQCGLHAVENENGRPAVDGAGALTAYWGH